MTIASYTHEPAAHDDPVPQHEEEVIVFDRDAARAVDRAAMAEFGIPGIVLMENAARGAAEVALSMLEEADAAGSRVLIVCGPGNNGGDGYALARLLHNRGVHVVIAALTEPRPESDAGINCHLCQKMHLSVIDSERVRQMARIDSVALIVDAVFGTGLDREVDGVAKQMIEWINHSNLPVLALDVPSGMDCNTGLALGACVKATRTVTFVGLKPGFLELDAQKMLGEVHVADIGAPRELIERYGRRIALSRRPEAPEHESDYEMHAESPGQRR